MNTLQNSKAIKILNKLIDDVVSNGIITNTVVEDLKELRPYTISEELPLLAKATRLAAEHIEAHGTFDMSIPQDDPVDEDDVVEVLVSEPKDSLHYFFCLIRDIDKKANEEELREYVKALNEY
jgi:hypothetical protein